ncbi:MAG: CDP-alcohol phosphatidyltransferase family protein [Myxococcota bacterium]
MSTPWLTVPNAISLFRLVLAPVFVALLFTHHAWWALATFAVAMASDAIDGLLARLLHQQSKLGALLDPIADKLLVFAALAALTYFGRIPLWLLGLVAFRDGLMGIGALMVRWKNREIPTAPTRISKYATFASTCLVVLALASLEASSPLLDAYVAVVGFIAGLCVGVSTVQYFARFGYLWFVPPRRESSADEKKERQPRA